MSGNEVRRDLRAIWVKTAGDMGVDIAQHVGHSVGSQAVRWAVKELAGQVGNHRGTCKGSTCNLPISYSTKAYSVKRRQ